MNPETEKKLNEALKKMKLQFPFRIVFAVLEDDHSFEVYAKSDKRLMNKFAREGNQVFTIGA